MNVTLKGGEPSWAQSRPWREQFQMTWSFPVAYEQLIQIFVPLGRSAKTTRFFLHAVCCRLTDSVV